MINRAPQRPTCTGLISHSREEYIEYYVKQIEPFGFSSFALHSYTASLSFLRIYMCVYMELHYSLLLDTYEIDTSQQAHSFGLVTLQEQDALFYGYMCDRNEKIGENGHRAAVQQKP